MRQANERESVQEIVRQRDKEKKKKNCDKKNREKREKKVYKFFGDNCARLEFKLLDH